MATFFNPTSVRALILAVILAGVAAVTAPVARGASEPDCRVGRGSEATQAHQFVRVVGLAAAQLDPPYILLADDFSWHEFVKFWERQAGTMTGVVGTVLLVAAAAVLLVLYKGKA